MSEKTANLRYTTPNYDLMVLQDMLFEFEKHRREWLDKMLNETRDRRFADNELKQPCTEQTR
jgi:hypothetical protein